MLDVFRNLKVRSASAIEHVMKLQNILFVCYLVIMFLMSFVRIFDNYFWYDEVFSIDCARMPLLDLLACTAADVHPPLYYIILKFFYVVFGESGTISHFSAIIPVILFFVLCGTYIHRTWGKMTSILLVTACTLLPAAVVYNVEVRMYSWASLFVLLGFLKVRDILEQRRWCDYILFMLSSLCAAYTHYYALVAVGFLYIFLLAIDIYHKRFRKIIIISTGTIIAYLPWLYQFMKALRRTTDDWWMTELPTVNGCLIFMFGNLEIFLLFGVVVGVYLLRKKSLWLASGIFSCIGTIALGMVMSYSIRPLFEPRYIFIFIGILWLILGICISELPYKRIVGCLLICYIFYCFFVPYRISYTEEQNRDKALEAFVNQVAMNEDCGIITTHTYLQTTIGYYYPDPTISYAPDAESIQDVVMNQVDTMLYLFIPSYLTEDVLGELERIAPYQKWEYMDEVIISHTALNVYVLK